jgi:hypothetical protein
MPWTGVQPTCATTECPGLPDGAQSRVPIATGVIEGACRHLIKDRLEKTGARWSLKGAESVLKLRALRSSHDFDAYWQHHLGAEFERNHASRYEGGKVPNPLPGRPTLVVVK